MTEGSAHDASLSRFLSWILRHGPDEAGAPLDPGGWMALDAAVRAARGQGRQVTADDIRTVVKTQPKPRFTLSADGERIRANYGHSVEVDLELEPTPPPEALFHGTARRFLSSILEAGLLSRGRQWVHLSASRGDAVQVGARHGRAVVLVVRAAEMAEDGFVFLRPARGFWLVEEVPATYLEAEADGGGDRRPEEGR